MSVACVSVVIGHPSPIFLRGLESVFTRSAGFNVLATCTDQRTCFAAMRDWSPNLALVDVSLLKGADLHLLVASSSDTPRTRLIVLVASADKAGAVATALPGIFGVVSREIAPESLLNSMRQAAAGKRFLPLAPGESIGSDDDKVNRRTPVPSLTQREGQVAQLVSLGLSNKEIARELSVTAGTVKLHLHRVYQKLAVHNRTALAVRNARGRE